jgi:hypothetical protein
MTTLSTLTTLGVSCLALLNVAACGGKSDSFDGNLETSTSTGVTTSTETHSATATKTDNTTATQTESSTTGGQTNPTSCPSSTCEWTMACLAIELDKNGCSTCRCAPMTLRVRDQVFSKEYLTFHGTASPYIGGYNRWDLNLTWKYDVPETDDEEVTLSVSLSLLSPPLQFPLQATHVIFKPGSSENEYRITASLTEGWKSDTLDIGSGELFITETDTELSGQILLEFGNVSAQGDILITK